MKKIKVLHVLYQSLPDTAGSSIRSRDLIQSQKTIGLDVNVITSPFQEGISNDNFDLIDGIEYYRTYCKDKSMNITVENKRLILKIKKFFHIFSFVNKVYKLAKYKQIDIIHAHATFVCGFAAIYVSWKLNIPFIYEVRSIWEEDYSTTTVVSRISKKIITFLENFTMKRANYIVAINENLKDELEKRNLNKPILVVNNAVNLDNIKILEKSNKDIVFGFIGSIIPLEGLELLINVFNDLEKEGISNKLLIYGKGIDFDKLKYLIEKNKQLNVELKGHVDSNKIFEAYSTIDVIVNPRIKNKMSDAVTPLKPLEAMGYKKLVLASNVGGMKELITDNKTGILFEAESSINLKNKIKNIINDGIDKKIIENAFSYVKSEKSWNSNAEKYLNVYSKLIENRK